MKKLLLSLFACTIMQNNAKFTTTNELLHVNSFCTQQIVEFIQNKPKLDQLNIEQGHELIGFAVNFVDQNDNNKEYSIFLHKDIQLVDSSLKTIDISQLQQSSNYLVATGAQLQNTSIVESISNVHIPKIIRSLIKFISHAIHNDRSKLDDNDIYIKSSVAVNNSLTSSFVQNESFTDDLQTMLQKLSKYNTGTAAEQNAIKDEIQTNEQNIALDMYMKYFIYAIHTNYQASINSLNYEITTTYSSIKPGLHSIALQFSAFLSSTFLSMLNNQNIGIISPVQLDLPLFFKSTLKFHPSDYNDFHAAAPTFMTELESLISQLDTLDNSTIATKLGHLNHIALQQRTNSYASYLRKKLPDPNLNLQFITNALNDLKNSVAYKRRVDMESFIKTHLLDNKESIVNKTEAATNTEQPTKYFLLHYYNNHQQIGNYKYLSAYGGQYQYIQ